MHGVYHRPSFFVTPAALGDSLIPPDPPEAPDREPQPAVPVKIEEWLAVIAMAAIALITFANVLVRYFTDASFGFTEEISVFLLVVLTLVGGSAAIARDRHIKIEFFVDAAPHARRRRMLQFAALCSSVFFMVLAALSVRMVWDEYRYEETTPGIGLPKWWYSIWLPLLSLAISARAFGLFLRYRRRG